MADEYTGPCRTCGSTDVRVVESRGELLTTDAAPPIVGKRVCGNQECSTNTGKSLLAVV